MIVKSQIGSLVRSIKIIRNPYFGKIPFHHLGGKIFDGIQYLFDGSSIIYPHGSDKVHNIYRLTRGAPEPEEIYLFLKLIKKVKKNGVMLEIGAGQGFYSLIASNYLTRGKLILVEANPRFIQMLNQNMVLNKLQNRWIIVQKVITNSDNRYIKFREFGYASSIHKKGQYQVESATIDNLVKQFNLLRINIVHMDIQGEELNALYGMEKLLKAKNIDIIMIGTHDVKLHQDCEKFLISKNYPIIFSKDLTKCSSYDGILIAGII